LKERIAADGKQQCQSMDRFAAPDSRPPLDSQVKGIKVAVTGVRGSRGADFTCELQEKGH
jgi:hypothetical protein